MVIKKLHRSDWPSFLDWYGGDGAPSDILIPFDTGFVAYDNKGPLAIGFLILTNADFAMADYIQTNPNRSKIRQGRGMYKIVEFLINYAKELGYRAIAGFTPDTNSPVIKMYENWAGAQISQRSAKFIFKLLEG